MPTALNAQDNAAYTLTILHNNDGESKLLHNPDRATRASPAS